MQLHELKAKNKSRKPIRVGRGGKRGTFSGRGTKGQKARAGRRIRPAERDLIQRLPKLKGFRNKSLKVKPFVLNAFDLEKKIKGNAINKKALLEAGLITEKINDIKILGTGAIKRPFQVEGVKVSKAAGKKIEKAGGKISE